MKRQALDSSRPNHLDSVQSDRRRLRSTNLGQALQLQLEACRKDAELDAIVVSDDLGLCVAASGVSGAGAPGVHDELAAWLPLSARAGLDSVPARLKGDRVGAPTSLRRFMVDASALFICVVGGQSDTRAAGLVRAETGFRRILAAAGS